MAEEKKDKSEEEREYTVPLRRKFLRTPKYKRVPKAIKALKKFIARHMKLYDRDLRKIKIDRYLNEEMWFRGIRNPPHKIRVKVKKEEDNIIVELVELSEKAKWKKAREERLKKTTEERKKEKEAKKKEEEARKKEEGVEEEIKETKEEKTEEKEKEKATVEAGMKLAEKQAREIKHETKMRKEPKHQFRQALQK